MSMSIFKSLNAVLPALLIPAFAGAAQTNYRSVIPGERAVGFGGAYTALSDTAEGGYYNPAGLAFIDSSTLSVTGNFYRFVRGERKSALSFAGTTTDLSQNSFTAIPQLAAFAQRLRLPWEDQTDEPLSSVALTVVTADQVYLSGQVDLSAASGEAAGSRAIRGQTLLVGPSFARRITDRLSAGVTLFYLLEMSERTAFLVSDTPGTFSQAFLNVRQTVGNLLARVGVRYSPVGDLWLGFTYQTPCLRLHGTGEHFFSGGIFRRGTNEVESSIRNESDLSPHAELPQSFSFGAAYGRPGRWMVAGDAIVHLANDFPSTDGPAGYTIQQEAVVNFSAGGELYLTPSVPLRAGVFSDFTAAQDVSRGTGADRVNNLGVSLAVALERKNTTLSLGGVISFGRGEGLDNAGNRIDVTYDTYSMLLSGSYKF